MDLLQPKVEGLDWELEPVPVSIFCGGFCCRRRRCCSSPLHLLFDALSYAGSAAAGLAGVLAGPGNAVAHGGNAQNGAQGS